MSLVNRVSAFFLVALAVVLLANSGFFYVLTRHQLQRQFDEQLHAALHTLVAAVEVEPDDVKWEVTDHRIDIGTEDGSEDVRWVVYGDGGEILDRSKNITQGEPSDEEFLKYALVEQSSDDVAWEVGDWGFLQRRLKATDPKPKKERATLEHAAIVVTVGRSAVELNSNLRLLAILVTALPLSAWVLAAVAGRWFCAKAIRPVKEMATQTRRMMQDGFGGRLALPVSKDELADLAQAFNSLLDRLSEAFQRQRRFTGDAAHQLRTPISVLLGQIEVALRRPRSSDEYQQTLEKLKTETQDLGQLVASLLFLARADGDSQPPDLEKVCLTDWLDNYSDRWKNNVRNSDLRFELGQNLHATISPQLLSQLLDNLIDNALKYSGPGTPVVVSARQVDAQVVVTVADEGIGIPNDDYNLIFQPFYRSQQARQTGEAGTGLGLAIAHRIADFMHATLSVRPNVPRGSCFVLKLERKPEAAYTTQALAIGKE
jgi:signal transduction histidine kinase